MSTKLHTLSYYIGDRECAVLIGTLVECWAESNRQWASGNRGTAYFTEV